MYILESLASGVPVVRPDALPPEEIDLVIVSSDRYEDRLLERARQVAAGRCRVRGIYRGRRFVTEWGRSVARPRFARTRRWVQALLFAPQRRWNWGERFVRAFHRAQMRRAWHDAPEPPHFEDHRSLLALWPEHRNPEFMACGTYARELMEPGCSVLDLCCGDGFYSYHFYGAVAGHVDAVDIDREALAIARQYHQAPNIRYHRLDVLEEDFPAARYDVVVWDGSLGHFRAEQIERLLPKIALAIGDHGVLSGSEDVETVESKSWDHLIALETPQRAHQLLAEHFPCVRLLVRGHPEPCVYFRCGHDPSRLGGWTQPPQT